MGRAWLMLFVLVLGGSARAEDLPSFDVRIYCAANGGSPARSAAGACQRAEEEARGKIGARWTRYPKQRKHFCVQSVTFRRKDQRSYVTLAECLDDPTTS